RGVGATRTRRPRAFGALPLGGPRGLRPLREPPALRRFPPAPCAPPARPHPGRRNFRPGTAPGCVRAATRGLSLPGKAARLPNGLDPTKGVAMRATVPWLGAVLVATLAASAARAQHPY